MQIAKTIHLETYIFSITSFYIPAFWRVTRPTLNVKNLATLAAVSVISSQLARPIPRPRNRRCSTDETLDRMMPYRSASNTHPRREFTELFLGDWKWPKKTAPLANDPFRN